MIKFDNDEFLKPQIYSTNDEYDTRCNVTKEIVDDIKQLQQENQKYKEVIDKAIEYIENRYDYEQNVLMYTFDRDNLKELYEILKGE